MLGTLSNACFSGVICSSIVSEDVCTFCAGGRGPVGTGNSSLMKIQVSFFFASVPH